MDNTIIINKKNEWQAEGGWVFDHKKTSEKFEGYYIVKMFRQAQHDS